MKENGIPLEQALCLCQRKKCGNLPLHHSLTRQRPTFEEALECLAGKDIALNRNILDKAVHCQDIFPEKLLDLLIHIILPPLEMEIMVCLYTAAFLHMGF